MQKSTERLIPLAPFTRFVREILEEDKWRTGWGEETSHLPGPTRMSLLALKALQEEVEAYVVHVLNMTNEVAIHSKRVTIMKRDMQLVIKLKKGTCDYGTGKIPRQREKKDDPVQQKTEGPGRNQIDSTQMVKEDPPRKKNIPTSKKKDIQQRRNDSSAATGPSNAPETLQLQPRQTRKKKVVASKAGNRKKTKK